MIVRKFKGSHTLCRCSHFKIWVEGQDGGCKECLAKEAEEYTVTKFPEESLVLKEGVRVLKNGRYMLNGKFIKPADAFI